MSEEPSSRFERPTLRASSSAGGYFFPELSFRHAEYSRKAELDEWEEFFDERVDKVVRTG
jgi:hypothetical protein